MAKTLAIFNKINSLRERYYKASIDKDALLKLIAETEVAEQVYNSNAIENSTLTLQETDARCIVYRQKSKRERTYLGSYFVASQNVDFKYSRRYCRKV